MYAFAHIARFYEIIAYELNVDWHIRDSATIDYFEYAELSGML